MEIVILFQVEAGFAGGFSGTLLNGGDLGQAFKAGVVGGVVGGASGFLAFAAGSITGNSINAILERMGRHAFVNAWMSGIQGQNMLSGALTGGASSLGGAGLTSLKIENVGLLSAANAVIGGTVSVIGGGKFANGAVTGAFTMLFNELAHKARYSSAKFKAQLEKTRAYFSEMSKLIDAMSLTSADALLTKSAFFAMKVKTGAEYDIKKTSYNEEMLGADFVYFEGAKMAPDDFGNYNYGVAAKAIGFSLTYANFGAGMSQTFLQNGNDWSNWWGFFDFKSDTEMIKKGYNRFK